MKIYLDYNVLIFLKDKKSSEINSEELEKKIANYKLNGHCFFFSPAHLEELAVSKRHSDVDDEVIIRDIGYFTYFFGKNSIRPKDDSVVFRTEYPETCYNRAISGSYLNDCVESLSKERLKIIKSIKKNNSQKMLDKSDFDVLIDHLRNIEFEAFSDIIVYKDENTLSLIRNSFNFRQNAIETLSHLCELKNIYPEKIKNSRSRLYDISHIIYASYTELFITNDAKLLQKAKIIYDFLNIKTEVLSLKELLSN